MYGKVVRKRQCNMLVCNYYSDEKHAPYLFSTCHTKKKLRILYNITAQITQHHYKALSLYQSVSNTIHRCHWPYLMKLPQIWNRSQHHTRQLDRLQLLSCPKWVYSQNYQHKNVMNVEKTFSSASLGNVSVSSVVCWLRRISHLPVWSLLLFWTTQILTVLHINSSRLISGRQGSIRKTQWPLSARILYMS
jgi:hypothetical protein